MLIKLSVSESFADTFNLEITCLILLSHSPNIGPHCLTWLACLVWYTHTTPAQPRDSGRWLNQRIIRSTIFKPPQDWQIIIYTSTTKIFWEISAVSSLDLASCGLLVSAGLSGARGKTGIFLFLCGGANINKYGRNIHLFCPGLRHQSSKLIQTPNFPFPHSYITPHTD